MQKPYIELLFKTAKGSMDGFEDWYYYFQGHGGKPLVIHELRYVDGQDRVKTDQTIMNVSEFMMMGKYPQQAKDKLQQLQKLKFGM